MSAPTTWEIGEVFTSDGVRYRTCTRTRGFIIATRVGAQRDAQHEVMQPSDIIRINRP